MIATAVLTSGGMDSCALLAETARHGEAYPIYVETGMLWERAEQAALDSFIGALGHQRVHPIIKLQLPVRPLYGGNHWTMNAEDVPGYSAPDERVHIPGRNIILITLAAVWCSLNRVNRIAIGTLAGNPFPDATAAFFKSIARTHSMALNHELDVVAPFRDLQKRELLTMYADEAPLQLTLTCSNPVVTSDGVVVHCANCNKCRERHEAFLDAGIRDSTAYARALR